MSILEKAKKMKFSNEMPDLKGINIQGLEIPTVPRLNQLVAFACGGNSLFDQIPRYSINVVQMAVRGQSGFHNLLKGREEKFDFEDYMYDINIGINLTKAKKTKLFGYSHGGYFTLAYAIQNPTRISSLILVEPAWNVPAEELKKRAELCRSGDGVKGITSMLDYVDSGDTQQSKYRTEYAKEISVDWKSKETIAKEYLVRAENPITVKDLASVRVPTLLIYGTESKIKESTLEAARHIPDITVWGVKGADHLSLMQDARYTGEMAEVISLFTKYKG